MTVAVLLGAMLNPTEPAFSAPSAALPQLRFAAAANAVTVTHWPGFPIWPDLGTYIIAENTTFEVWLKRASYADPVLATAVLRRTGGPARHVPLPTGLATDFAGFRAFTHLTISDPAGRVRVDRDDDFCPNGAAFRTRPDAVDRSPYPSGCPRNPFTLGSVWGLPAGWGTPAVNPNGGAPIVLPDGTYSATVSVNQPYRDVFGMAADESSVTVALTVRTVAPGTAGAPSTAANPPAPALVPAATSVAVPAAAFRPDLRSLPAWGISMRHEAATPGSGARDYLTFSATIWVAGTSPLVVDGFRRAGADIMDAYQYFYDAAGRQIGYAPVGTMEWDTRTGHNHWHFTDFAHYRLVDVDHQPVVDSGKQAFCLANTDAVDLTIPFANWQPGGSDLHTACGVSTSLSVREVLAVGSGDTYAQQLPGQSFNVTDVPNGTYLIEIAANPDGRLHELDIDNDVSWRLVTLAGEPGARTVAVPPQGE